MSRHAFATVVLLLVCLTSRAQACLWDRDTPQEEAKGLSHVVAALTGRFERNPPLYYEMRLERVAQHVRANPADLAAYDDAGVACDRLGRGDEACAWMKKKRAQLEAREAADQTPTEQDETRTHWYRYHANLGTFIVHQWLRAGADRAQIETVRSARKEIARAIEINPRAHFGRETYQLRAMDWLISPPEYSENLLGWSFRDIYGDETQPSEAREAVEALTGLIVLGNAWESVDIFNALNVALQRDSVGYKRWDRNGGRNTLAYFAWLRCRELIDEGHGSLYPGSPKGEELKNSLMRPDFEAPEILLDPVFAKLRAEAKQWHTDRTNFMLARLQAGSHPDTNADFWDGYVAAAAPDLPTTSVPDAFKRRRARVAWMTVVGGVVFFICSFGGICYALQLWLQPMSANSVTDDQESNEHEGQQE